MKIYLDTCSLQRPFDNKSQVRVLIEAEAVLGILSYVEKNKIILVNSDILEYEASNIPNALRRFNSQSVLKLAASFIKLEKRIEKRASELNDVGIQALDSLHIASAEAAKVDYFCTCDDKLISKTRRIELKIKVVTPIELIGVIER